MGKLGRKVVVTGASGHIGYNVAKHLCDRGFAVNLLVRKVNTNVCDLVARGARHHIVDFKRPETLTPVLQDVDCLFHLAAENTTSQQAPKRVLDSTVGLTRSILMTAADCGVATAVYTSSVVVLGRSDHPEHLLAETDRTTQWESPYVKGKVEADAFCERLMRERGMDIRRLYPSWVVGPGDIRGTPPHRVINRCLQKGQRFYFEGGISLASVEAVAQAHVEAWLCGQACESYVLGGDNITFYEFFTLLTEISGKARPTIYLPKWLIVAIATVGKACLRPFGKEPPIGPQYARTVIGSYSYYDSSKAVRDLGYIIPLARDSLTGAARGERRRLAGTYSLGKPYRLAAPAIGICKEAMPPLLITGVPGWLGNRFVDTFINGDPLGRRPPRRRIRLLVEPRFADLLDLPDMFEIFPGDICDPKVVWEALAGIGTVFHLAAAVYPPHIKTLYRVNAEGTRNLVDQCMHRGVRRILYMSTDSLCGYGSPEQRIFDENTPDRPYRHYGRSKWMAERYVLENTAAGRIDGTSLRGFWFFGPYAPKRQRRFLKMMHWRRQIVFGNGKNYRSISHVDNTVAAFLRAETVPATYGKWYWIGDARPDYTVDELYSQLCQAVGSTYRPIYVPRIVCRTMAVVDAVMGQLGRLHATVQATGKFAFDIAGRIDAARRDFGYAPVVSLKENTRAYIDVE